ncbi:CPBP family intramembrane glutamic endopeptidase [Sporosarcina jiandibaonis]|uniref:CPBP family intramembrane glutamic endopeptidase n=1 Tax=Sporosarcina jiandibaonis TaxID=2715535 RepID=UPI001C12DA46|nr:CPBP family intramembrane glutamic endopeptidase [Sporosarcina jiandibaonis]
MKNWKIYFYLIFTYVIMQIGSVFLVKPIFQYFKGNPSLTSQEAEYHGIAWSLFTANTLAAIIFLLLIFTRKKFFHVFKGKPASVGSTILWGVIGFFLALFGQMAAGFIEQMMGIEPGSENTAFLSEIAKVSPIIIICIVVFAPLLEEIVFRRVIFGGLYQKTNFIIAALVSGLIFAAVHGELQHLLIYLAPGLVFSFIYFKTKRLIAPMISHLLMNGLVVTVQLNYDKIEQLQNMHQSFIAFLIR